MLKLLFICILILLLLMLLPPTGVALVLQQFLLESCRVFLTGGEKT